MSEQENVVSIKRGWMSLDSWAVIVALLAALLIRVGIFRQIPW